MRIYGRILRTPHIAALIGAVLLTRLPFAINGLAIVLFLREETGSFGVAGLVAGALALGAAAGAPYAGRLVDRRGARMLVPLAAAHATAILAVWALGATGAPSGPMALAAMVAGASLPPTGALLRSRYPELVRDEDLLHGAYALDSVTIELAFVGGPLLTAVVVALVGPEYALGVSAVCVLLGTALFRVWMPQEGMPHPVAAEHSGLLGVLAHPGIRAIALITLPVGFCMGTIEVAIPAFSREHGDPALAGVLLAIWSAASGAGGLAYGAWAVRGARFETFIALALSFPLACLPLLAAGSPLAMGLLVVLAGIPIAPLIASRNQLVGALAPRGTGAESFTWLLTALVTGVSAGTAAGGALVEAAGWAAAVALGCGIGALGAAGAYAFRDAVRPRLAPG